MKKIKVLIVAGEMNVGGIENQLMHLLRQADKQKFQIDFTTTVNHPFYQNEMERLGAKCIRIPETKGKHFLKYCRVLYRVMKDGEYDIVHSHELFHSGMVLLTARIAGVKGRFVHAHNWSDSTEKKKKWVRILYNCVMQKMIVYNATQFIACSSFAGRFLYGDYIIHQNNFHLVFNSVDTHKYIALYDQKESGEYCDNWTNVIQVGRFTDVKNQLFTVEIARELKRRNKRIRILCVGNTGNQYEEQVREKIAVLELENYIKLLGIREDVDVLMRKSKAFLLPSKYEGMPLVLIEAQASGLPCVVANTFSREVDFGIGTVEWLSLEEGVETWTNALEKAIQKGRAPKFDVKNAVQEKRFDSKMFAQTLCDLYQKECNFQRR